MTDLTGKAVAFLVAPEGIEQVELTDPWQSVEKAGGKPHLLSTESGEVQAFHHLEPGDTFKVDAEVGNSDVKEFVESGKPVAAICHAPWVLAEADVVRYRRVTSWPSLRTDLVNAGAEWVDEEVVVHDNLITSRRPDDLPAFCRALLDAVS